MQFFVLSLLVSALIIGSSTGQDPDWTSATKLCYKLLRISPEDRKRFEQSYSDDDPNTHCIVRCGGILLGIYDDDTGVRLDQVAKGVAAQDSKDALEVLRNAYEQCAAAIKPQDYGSSYCKKGFLHIKCYLLFSG